VKVLALTHGDDCPVGVFGEVVRAGGHQLDEWRLEDGLAPNGHDALLVFGGAMHADQEDRHPWLSDELELLRAELGRETPMLGVCLGAQLLAKAAGGDVYAAEKPEIGWHEVELTEAAAEDPVFAALPARFEAFQWHYYTFDLPREAVELGRSRRCRQAFRVGPAAWGIQFHAEVTPAIVGRWIDEAPHELPESRAELQRRSRELIGEWNGIGRTIAGAFLDAAAI
jgi:GMP synthase-like glutamine amidotransferase